MPTWQHIYNTHTVYISLFYLNTPPTGNTFLPHPPTTVTMSHAPPPTAFTFLLLSLFLFSTATVSAHNITHILAKHPEFSTFNHYLTETHLASEINHRQTITVLALDNAAMSSLIDKHLSLTTLRNVLSLHVLVDYFGTKKLHQITGGSTLSSTMFQATGAAPGTSGYLNITDLKGGKVAFAPEENDGKMDALFVKSVVEMPYNISILHISQALNSAEAEAPAAAPSINLTAILHKQGCTKFADLLSASGAQSTFEDNVDGGLTVLCPSDASVTSFMPKYKNLTNSQKLSLCLYHGIPVFMSMQMLKSNNGVINTLATDGAKKYDITVQDDGEIVKLETKVVTATITGTLKEQDPLIVLKVDKVLQPKELFKAVVDDDAEAPAPRGAKSTKAKGKGKAKAVAESPDDADAPEGDSDDSTAADEDQNGVGKLEAGRLVMVGLSLCIAVMLI
ncbi:Fasciclin-like arabinogalactan protein 2 [Linum perenne]